MPYNSSLISPSHHYTYMFCEELQHLKTHEVPPHLLGLNHAESKKKTLVICYIAIENGPVELVDFPINNGDFP